MTTEHGERIIADIVAEWATLHTEPFTLHLTGPAGGTYRRGTAGVAPDGRLPLRRGRRPPRVG